jgi:capsule biosynthesis phosphatase
MEKPYTFIIDVDGTLCPIKAKDESYADLVPYREMVDQIRRYHDAGARIVLFTSRNMNSYGGNLGLINKHTAKTMTEWLEKWEIPYDEILFGKPWPGHNGFYVDDRTVRPDEFLKFDPAALESLCENSRKELK